MALFFCCCLDLTNALSERSRPLARALSARGFEAPTPVQAAVVAPEALGRDLLVSARTGSGKTVAFGLALADTLLAGAERCPPPPRRWRW